MLNPDSGAVPEEEVWGRSILARWAIELNDPREDIYTIEDGIPYLARDQRRKEMAITSQRATLDDLMRTEGKAELIDGRIVQFMATGRRPNRIAARIFRRLDEYTETSGVGEAYTDNMGFSVPQLPSGRESFSPDASYFAGPFSPDDMKFIAGAPTFAVEVRSENDTGDAAEGEMAAKRADYFAAGTLVVWDVDPIAETIDRYLFTAPTTPVRFQRGQTADAEPAVPGWRISVDDVFDSI